MEEVYVYTGQTESELEEELKRVELAYESAKDDCKRRKKIIGIGLSGTLINLVGLGTVVLAKDLKMPPYYLIYGGYVVMFGYSVKNNCKKLKEEKQLTKELKMKRKSLCEKLPIEVDYSVK